MSGESAVERVKAALETAHATQPTLNAFISLDDDRAIERAQLLDENRAASIENGPLDGVPIALKDLIDHEGRVNTGGSAFYRNVATRTATSVARLEEAGAVIIGRANLHEWAFGFNSENDHWGPVRNPWNLDTSPGGSSGGSAAAVAAGITPIAIGTDTGGSVRVPAALCGIYGLKVTYGRIPLDGVFPLVPTVDTVGPLADSISNVELGYRAMADDHRPLPTIDGPLRFGIPEPWVGEAPLQPGMGEAFTQATEALADMGHSVERIELPGVHPSSKILGAIAEVAEVHRQFRQRGALYGPAIEERIAVAEATTQDEIAEGRAWQMMLRNRLADAFQKVDFIVTPACAAFSKRIGVDDIGGRDHRSVLSHFSAPVNHALHPALAMPILDTGRPPASLQVVGPLNSELDLIALAQMTDRLGLTGFRSPTANSPMPGRG